MSKAFTKESDDLPEPAVLTRQPTALPPGVKNFMTPAGMDRLQDELIQLLEVERPRVAAAAEASGERRELQQLDQRIEGLHQSLQSAVVVPPPSEVEDQVRFGATVVVRERDGTQARYRIVGVAETDPDRGDISWRSPLAQALLNASVGGRVRFRIPAGEEELEILEVNYE